MCGITGFTGAEAALPFIVEGLEKLEYRGYDSAGVTLVDKNDLFTCKVSGRLDKLKAKLGYPWRTFSAQFTSAYKQQRNDLTGS